MGSVPLTLGRALGTWQFAPVVSGLLVVLAACYLTAAGQVRHRHPARPWAEPACSCWGWP